MTKRKTRIIAFMMAFSMVLAPAVSLASNTKDNNEKENIVIERISGKNRSETSIKVAEKLGGVEKAFITSGQKFPDALSSGTIAAKEKAPIILSNNTEEIHNKVKNIGVKDMVIVGGNTTVTQSEEELIKNKFDNVSRISGSNRYETSRKLLNKYNIKNVGVVGGNAYADALTANSYLYKNKNGVLLMNIVFDFPNELTPTVTIGGKGSIEETYGNKRISGKNRYETAVELAKEFGDFETLIITDGNNFADALSAAPLAGKEKAPILLTSGSYMTDSVKDLVKKAKKVIIVGGESSVPKDIVDQIKKLNDNEINENFDKENIKEIKLLNTPTKLEYITGETLNLEGLKIELIDKEDIKINIDNSKLDEYKLEVNPSKEDKLNLENKEVTIKIKDEDITPIKFNIDVKEKNTPEENDSIDLEDLVSLKMVNDNSRTRYLMGDRLNLNEFKIEIKDSKGNSKIISGKDNFEKHNVVVTPKDKYLLELKNIPSDDKEDVEVMLHLKNDTGQYANKKIEVYYGKFEISKLPKRIYYGLTKNINIDLQGMEAKISGGPMDTLTFTTDKLDEIKSIAKLYNNIGNEYLDMNCLLVRILLKDLKVKDLSGISPDNVDEPGPIYAYEEINFLDTSLINPITFKKGTELTIEEIAKMRAMIELKYIDYPGFNQPIEINSQKVLNEYGLVVEPKLGTKLVEDGTLKFKIYNESKAKYDVIGEITYTVR